MSAISSGQMLTRVLANAFPCRCEKAGKRGSCWFFISLAKAASFRRLRSHADVGRAPRLRRRTSNSLALGACKQGVITLRRKSDLLFRVLGDQRLDGVGWNAESWRQ